jgi:hypothetical protein
VLGEGLGAAVCILVAFPTGLAESFVRESDPQHPYRLFVLGTRIMPEDAIAPVVSVVFACAGCREPFMAAQIFQPGSSGKFRCVYCGNKVHVWSGSYDYAAWRSVARSRHRDEWSWEKSPCEIDLR